MSKESYFEVSESVCEAEVVFEAFSQVCVEFVEEDYVENVREHVDVLNGVVDDVAEQRHHASLGL